MKKWINRGKPLFFSPEEISKVEEEKTAKYVGDFCTKNKFGGWTEFPVSIFYQENPPTGYNKYFGLYRDTAYEDIRIIDGSDAISGEIAGVLTPSGEIIYSRSTHDFRYSSDKYIAIDGGRDYTRLVGDDLSNVVYVTLTIKEGKILADGEELPYYPSI